MYMNENFDRHYFKNIDSEEKAYWLGFIYADGYICNYELGIKLKSTDDYLLSQLAKNLGDYHKVTYRDNHKIFNGYEYDTHSCLIRIYALDIVEDLKKIGIVPNKTNSKIYPRCDEYFFSFLKGFLDGDGCIYRNKNKNSLCVSFTNANADFLEYLNNTISQKINIKGRIYKENEKKYKLMFFRKDDVKILLDEIYSCKTDSYLTRKYEIYKSYYGFAA